MRSYENDVTLARLKKAKVSEKQKSLFLTANFVAKKHEPVASVVEKEYAKHNKSCSNLVPDFATAQKLLLSDKKLNTHNSPTSVGTLIEIAAMLNKLSDDDKIVLNLLVRHYS